MFNLLQARTELMSLNKHVHTKDLNLILFDQMFCNVADVHIDILMPNYNTCEVNLKSHKYYGKRTQ